MADVGRRPESYSPKSSPRGSRSPVVPRQDSTGTLKTTISLGKTPAIVHSGPFYLMKEPPSKSPPIAYLRSQNKTCAVSSIFAIFSSYEMFMSCCFVIVYLSVNGLATFNFSIGGNWQVATVLFWFVTCAHFSRICVHFHHICFTIIGAWILERVFLIRICSLLY